MAQLLRKPKSLVLFLRITLLASCVPALMRLPLARLQRVLEPRRVPPPPKPEDLSSLANHVDWVLRKARPIVRPGCLTRGVTLYYFLRRAGGDVSLAFGMGVPDASEFAGHCWLVRDGEPFLERTDPRQRFTEIVRLPALQAS